MLKAFYNDAPIINPSVPNATGTELMPYTGGALMMFDELDKLASNIGVGRLFAGVHYRSDHDHAGVPLTLCFTVQNLAPVPHGPVLTVEEHRASRARVRGAWQGRNAPGPPRK